MKRLTLTGALAIAVYAAAAGTAVAHWSDGFWFIGIICFLMCVRPHPAFGHLVCSAFLVLWELIYLGRIEWMSDLVPTFGIVFCLAFSTKMIEEARKPLPEPEPAVLCPLERKRRHNEEIQRILLCGSFGDD